MSTEPTGLDEILSSEPEKTPAEPPAEPQAERPRDEHGRFAAKEPGGEPPDTGKEPEAAPPAADPPTVPRKALEDERGKRQRLEERLNMLENYFQQRQPQGEAPDFWNDPDAYFEARDSRLLEKWEHRQQVSRVDASERAAKAKYDDFDEVVVNFARQVQLNPELASEMALSDNPGEFAYRRGKQAQELASVGDLDALKAKLRAEWEAELKAQVPQSPSLPPSTAGHRSVGQRSGPEWSGPPTLNQILQG